MTAHFLLWFPFTQGLLRHALHAIEGRRNAYRGSLQCGDVFMGDQALGESLLLSRWIVANQGTRLSFGCFDLMEYMVLERHCGRP